MVEAIDPSKDAKRAMVCSHCQREVTTAGLFCPGCGSALPQAASNSSDPYVGRKVAKKYFVHQRLGGGGMGRVYKATDLILEVPVALKMMNQVLSTDPSIVQRFRQEALSAARLNGHPNSVEIHEFGQAEDGTLFIAMNYVPGRTLAQVIAGDFPIETGRVVNIVSQILAVLTKAHSLGIVHRDIKPENVIIGSWDDEGEFVKVLDFGIAHLLDADRSEGARLTKLGTRCGTPGYMSPEQLRGEVLDARSDLFAVGIVLYEMLTKKLPFEPLMPDDPNAVAVSPRQYEPSIPIALEALVLRALSLERSQRPQSAKELRFALEACVSAAPGVLPVATPAPSTVIPTEFWSQDRLDAATAKPATPAPSLPHPTVAIPAFPANVTATPAPITPQPAPERVRTPVPPSTSIAAQAVADAEPTILAKRPVAPAVSDHDDPDVVPASRASALLARTLSLLDVAVRRARSTLPRLVAPFANASAFRSLVLRFWKEYTKPLLFGAVGAVVLIVGIFMAIPRAESPTVSSFVAPTAIVEAGIAPVLKVSFGPRDAVGVISVENVGDGAHPCGAGPVKAGSVTVECAPIESITTYRFTATVGKRVVSKLFTVSVRPTIKTFSATTPVNAGEAPTFDVEFGPRGATGTISQSGDSKAQPCGAAPIAGGASARIACTAIGSETKYVLDTKLGKITDTKTFIVSVMPVITAFSAPKPAAPGTRPAFTLAFTPAGATGVISTLVDANARPCGDAPIAADASTVNCDPIRSTTTYLLTVQLGNNTATRKFVLPVMEPNLKCLKPGQANRPAATSGNGLLIIAMTSSWGTVSIDGAKNLGETPCAVQIAAGTHGVRVTPPSGHAINRTVTVAEGESRTVTFAR